MKPSFWRAAATLLVMIASCMVASGTTATGNQFWQRTGELVGLTTMVLAIVWLVFIPAELQFDRFELIIRYHLRRSRTNAWCGLEYYGPGRNVFVLQFEDRTFQIFSQAFAAPDWYRLVSFLDSRYPECKADGWLGGKGFRWRGN